jgi:hypothetical protein
MEQYPNAFEKLAIYCGSRVLEHAGIMHPGATDSQKHRAIVSTGSPRATKLPPQFVVSVIPDNKMKKFP